MNLRKQWQQESKYYMAGFWLLGHCMPESQGSNLTTSKKRGTALFRKNCVKLNLRHWASSVTKIYMQYLCFDQWIKCEQPIKSSILFCVKLNLRHWASSVTKKYIQYSCLDQWIKCRQPIKSFIIFCYRKSNAIACCVQLVVGSIKLHVGSFIGAWCLFPYRYGNLLVFRERLQREFFTVPPKWRRVWFASVFVPMELQVAQICSQITWRIHYISSYSLSTHI